MQDFTFMRVPIVPILSTLQLHSGMDCCLPTYVVISLLSSVLHLSWCVALRCISHLLFTC